MALKGILGALAPTLVDVATSANPIAGIALKMAAKKLNLPETSSLEEIEQLVEREPDKISALAQTENELKAMEINLEGFKVQAEDVKDARKHFSADLTPKIFSVLTLILYGAFVILVTTMPHDQNDETIISLVLGQLSGILGTAAAFYYGSSQKK